MFRLTNIHARPTTSVMEAEKSLILKRLSGRILKPTQILAKTSTSYPYNGELLRNRDEVYRLRDTNLIETTIVSILIDAAEEIRKGTWLLARWVQGV